MKPFYQNAVVGKVILLISFGTIGLHFNPNSQPLIPADDTMFHRYYPDLTVFIGTPVPDQSLNKDSSARWPNDPFMADGVLRVKYLVKEWVYGLEKPPDTMEMISYVHYGSFSYLKNSNLPQTFRAKGLSGVEVQLIRDNMSKQEQQDYELFLEKLTVTQESLEATRMDAMEKGDNRRARSAAAKLVLRGFINEDIADITGLSMDEIGEIRRGLN